jgi:rhamnose transport system substrate-binding protein
MIRKIPIILVILASLSLFLSGCGREETQTPAPAPASGEKISSEQKKITICLLPKKKGIPYFSSCAEGAQEAAKELDDVEVIYDGPTDGSPEKSAAMIEKWTLQKVDAICISPNDPDVLAPAMKKAREQGVKILTWDADSLPETRLFMVNQATPQQIGYALVDTMVKDIGGEEPEAEVAIITATLTAANQNAWIKYIKERLEQKYPKMKLVAIKPSKEDQKLAFEVTQDFMKAYPNLKGIFAISSVAFPASAEAVKQAGMAGKIHVEGLATPNDMRDYVKDGTIKSVVLWNTKDLGYLTIQAARKAVKGELKAGETSIDAGRLGTKKIEGDQILLGDILVFTKDNIDKFDF